MIKRLLSAFFIALFLALAVLIVESLLGYSAISDSQLVLICIFGAMVGVAFG